MIKQQGQVGRVLIDYLQSHSGLRDIEWHMVLGLVFKMILRVSRTELLKDDIHNSRR